MKLASAAAVPLFVLLALAGCATAAPQAEPTAAASSPAAEEDGACEVAVVVEFGSLEQEPIEACGVAGTGYEALDAAGIETEGIAAYGDDAICRVDEQPTPEQDACQDFSSTAYWAIWTKADADAEWESSPVGINEVALEEGQSLGLVYTPLDGEGLPPQD
jgi:hypothetical protein